MSGIVVTGASSGIGRAIALRLAKQAATTAAATATTADAVADCKPSLLIGYHTNAAGAEETARAVAALGGEATTLAVDLADPEDVDRFADQAFERLGSVHTWINNAGADVLTGEAGKWDFDEKLRRLLDVDVYGTIRLARRVGDRWIAQAEQAAADTPPADTPRPVPAMVMIGWDQAPAGMEGDAGMMFGPVKAAVMAFSNSLAQSLAPHARVNCVAPGWIQTAWGETTHGYWDRRARHQSLLGRWGTPTDVAEVVAMVCDPAAGFLNGQTIGVNGGWNRGYHEAPQ